MRTAERPATREAFAEALAAAAEAGTPVRFTGAGTKAGWAGPPPEEAIELSMLGLERIVEHNAGDLTAVLEAGVSLRDAQAEFAEAGQMLAIDPPGDSATLGGLVASGDSGPLRSRYGGMRDLVVGMRVALSDGSVARSGGKVIKNVAGYDLAKLFVGSFGSLGAVLEVAVRLHPLPPMTATTVGSSSDPAELGRGAIAAGRAQLEHHGLDVRWSGGRGAVLVRFAGTRPVPQAEAARAVLADAGLDAEVAEEDREIWAAQRADQRGRLTIKVSGLPTRLPAALRAVDAAGGSLVGRAGLGLWWIAIEEPEPGTVDSLRSALAPSPCVVLDRPAGGDTEAWSPLDPGAVELMRRVKRGFDPAGVCNAGAFGSLL